MDTPHCRQASSGVSLSLTHPSTCLSPNPKNTGPDPPTVRNTTNMSVFRAFMSPLSRTRPLCIHSRSRPSLHPKCLLTSPPYLACQTPPSIFPACSPVARPLPYLFRPGCALSPPLPPLGEGAWEGGRSGREGSTYPHSTSTPSQPTIQCPRPSPPIPIVCSLVLA